MGGVGTIYGQGLNLKAELDWLDNFFGGVGGVAGGVIGNGANEAYNNNWL